MKAENTHHTETAEPTLDWRTVTAGISAELETAAENFIVSALNPNNRQNFAGIEAAKQQVEGLFSEIEEISARKSLELKKVAPFDRARCSIELVNKTQQVKKRILDEILCVIEMNKNPFQHLIDWMRHKFRSLCFLNDRQPLNLANIHVHTNAASLWLH